MRARWAGRAFLLKQCLQVCVELIPLKINARDCRIMDTTAVCGLQAASVSFRDADRGAREVVDLRGQARSVHTALTVFSINANCSFCCSTLIFS